MTTMRDWFWSILTRLTCKHPEWVLMGEEDLGAPFCIRLYERCPFCGATRSRIVSAETITAHEDE